MNVCIHPCVCVLVYMVIHPVCVCVCVRHVLTAIVRVSFVLNVLSVLIQPYRQLARAQVLDFVYFLYGQL